jgi:hypothetical protein
MRLGRRRQLQNPIVRELVSGVGSAIREACGALSHTHA